METIHGNAVSQVEEALKLSGIYVAGFSGAIIHELIEDTSMGGNMLSPGKYVTVEFKVVVPVNSLRDLPRGFVCKGHPDYLDLSSILETR
jgi:hypothetical protein